MNFIDPQSLVDLNTAVKAIDAINALGLPARKSIAAELVRGIDRLQAIFASGTFFKNLETIRAGMGEFFYVVDFLLDVVGTNRMAAAREVLPQLTGLMLRTYPAAEQQGGLHGEDAILSPLLPEQDGRYIEIGAWRPIEQSSTWFLYQRGWSGLLVEPVPQSWGALLANRKRDHLIPYALSNQRGLARLWANGPMSSCRPDCSQAESTHMVVETLTLAEILEEFPEIRAKCSLCSIDVEGHEKEVLEGFDWATFRPRLLLIEYRDPVDGLDCSDKWRPIVESQGYREKTKTTNNLIFEIAPA